MWLLTVLWLVQHKLRAASTQSLDHFSLSVVRRSPYNTAPIRIRLQTFHLMNQNKLINIMTNFGRLFFFE